LYNLTDVLFRTRSILRKTGRCDQFDLPRRRSPTKCLWTLFLTYARVLLSGFNQ